MPERIHIIGGGLAGSECAFYLSERGFPCTLYEMRPGKDTPVHKTSLLAELVCSNSLKSEAITTASGLLKEELRLLGSRLLEIADNTRIEAGNALAVDRERFAQKVTEALQKRVDVVRQEVISFETIEKDAERTVVATGPLTSEALMRTIKETLETDDLYFFDAVAPIVDTDSIDMGKAFLADRYEQETETGELKTGSYINCPMNQEEYRRFRNALIEAETIEEKAFEKKKLFERCQPIEEIAKNGEDAMRFGPLKPVGLINPHTSERPYAVVQLRKEDLEGRMYNIVGFQTRLKWGEQKRIIRLIPGLENAEILRYGVMHKNTYINSPRLLDNRFRVRDHEHITFAGQITGVEGYMESVASGLYAGINIARELEGKNPINLPRTSILRGLFDYCTTAEKLHPMYANFGLINNDELGIKAELKKIRGKMKKKRKRKLIAEKSLENFKNWLEATDF